MFSARIRISRVLSSLTVVFLLGLLGGCEKPRGPAEEGGQKAAAEKAQPGEKAPPAVAKRSLSADEVLDKMTAAYRNASTYKDHGTVRMTADANGQTREEKYDFSVILVRPNKLQMKVYAAKVACDGKTFRATLDMLPGQVLTRDAPAKLTLPVLFRDGILAEALTEGLVGPSVQAMLLLGDNPKKTLLAGAKEPTLDAPAQIDGRDCYRVQIPRREGTVVLWIDAETFVLRRMVPPTDELLHRMQQAGNFENLSLVAEFTGATLNGKVDPTLFGFDLPKGAKAVKWLMPPASMLLGRKTPAFKFTGLDGKPVTPESLAKKIVVLDFWASWCPPCREGLPYLERVYQKYKDNGKVAFVAVSVDKPEVTDKDLEALFKKLKVHVPIARDLTRSADVLCFDTIPTTFVLGADGLVQYFDSRGPDPNVVKELPELLDRLLAGKNVYATWFERYEEAQKQHEQMSEAFGEAATQTEGPVKEIPVPQAEIASHSQPKTLKLVSLWRNTDVDTPGNVLVVPQPSGPPRLAVVVNKMTAIVELAVDGKIIAERPLELEKGELVSSLRTAVAPGGKRLFVAFASGQQRAHLFDEKWKLLVHYPEDALRNPHKGIDDVQLADLDGDGKLRLYIGYWDVVGVQAASLEGKRLAANRLVNNVRMAVGPAEHGRRWLLCTNNNGPLLVLLDSELHEQGQVFVKGRVVQSIVSADLGGDGRLQWCAMTGRKLGENVAVGFNLRGDELWSYTLPEGVQQQAIEPIIAGKVLAKGAGQWILPGPDGSIHVIAADGKLVDKWNYGAQLCGLATVEIGGKPAIIVVTPDGVEALRVE